jgi:hypothetical protein
MSDATDPRFSQQMQFLLEADKLKLVQRTSQLADGSRFENSAVQPSILQKTELESH